MLLFRDEEHIDRWCKARDLPRGATMTPEQGWRLAHEWFKDRLQPDWRRYTLDETESIFSSIGLTGDFWNLREEGRAWISVDFDAPLPQEIADPFKGVD